MPLYLFYENRDILILFLGILYITTCHVPKPLLRFLCYLVDHWFPLNFWWYQSQLAETWNVLEINILYHICWSYITIVKCRLFKSNHALGCIITQWWHNSDKNKRLWCAVQGNSDHHSVLKSLITNGCMEAKKIPSKNMYCWSYCKG